MFPAIFTTLLNVIPWETIVFRWMISLLSFFISNTEVCELLLRALMKSCLYPRALALYRQHPVHIWGRERWMDGRTGRQWTTDDVYVYKKMTLPSALMQSSLNLILQKDEKWCYTPWLLRIQLDNKLPINLKRLLKMAH